MRRKREANAIDSEPSLALANFFEQQVRKVLPFQEKADMRLVECRIVN